MIIEVHPTKIAISIDKGSADIDVKTPMARDYVNAEPYDGDYEITPSEEVVTLPTTNFRMTGDLKIQPIPSNYGRIAWNGSTLMVY